MFRASSPTANRIVTAGVVLFALVATLVLYGRLYRESPAPQFESDEEHFLYGSIGAEAREGIPYWVWLVLPRVFPDLLPRPGGYAALGLLSQDGREMPIGLSRVDVGYPRVAVNCAFCHTGSYRTSAGDLPRIVIGAPAHQSGAQAYRRFLAAAAADPRFNAGRLLTEISRNYRLSFVDRLLYRFAIIPGARRQLLAMGPAPGGDAAAAPGRADLFNVLKFQRFGHQPSASAAADSVPLWNAAAGEGRGFFWDGVHTSLRDAVVSSALSQGSARAWLDRDIERWDRTEADERSSLRRIQEFIGGLRPPGYPFPVDASLAGAGEGVFRSECAQCHAAGGSRAGEAIAVSEVGTDAQRAAVWTADATRAYEAFAERRAWKAPAFRTTGGYVAVPLDGLWMRAPYLHNGSVPTLSDLLEPVANRPVRFWRGYDVYDPVKVGFVSEGADAERLGTPYDATQPGNGNGGHSYGTTLTADEKRALVEYLKTL